jgi:hypothetical protein
MATPVIPAATVVTTTPTFDDSTLPNELKGKTPAEIVEYYRNRETLYVNRIDELVAQPPRAPQVPPAVKAAPSPSDFWNDPNSAVRAVAVSREEFNAAALGIQSNMIEVACMLTKNKFADFDKWESKVRNVLNNVAPHLKADPGQWETAYYYVKGQETDSLVNAATARAVQATSEPPSMIPVTPLIPDKLTPEESYVAKGLGLTEDQYRTGKQQSATNEWPLTFDSRKKKG